MVAPPNLTLTLTPPGGSPTNYTSKLARAGAAQSMTINQNFGRQGDTAVIPLVDEYLGTASTFYVLEMSQVKLVDNTAGQTLFAGVVTNPALSVQGTNLNEWDLSCVDYTFYADNAVVHGVFIGQTVDQIVVELTAQANCGISAATVRNGGFVAPGPQLASFVLNYVTLSEAWRRLAQLASQVTPYGWYVDENRKLHFYDSTTALASGVTFTTSPTAAGAGSLTEAHFDGTAQSTYEWDGASIRNRILIQGANQTITHGSVLTTAATDVFVGNGSQTSWALRYTVTGSPILKVNGVQTSVTIVNAGSAIPAGTAWYITQNAFGGWFLGAADEPSPGVILRIWYDYQVPIVAVANDHPSQVAYAGPNGGAFSEYINDTSLTTPPMALARAMRQRTEYAFAAERATFTTTPEWLGWARAGQTCTVVNRFVPDSRNSRIPGINGTFIIVANSVTFGQGGYRQAQITAIRL
jgi:hypothetical protein